MAGATHAAYVRPDPVARPGSHVVFASLQEGLGTRGCCAHTVCACLQQQQQTFCMLDAQQLLVQPADGISATAVCMGSWGR